VEFFIKDFKELKVAFNLIFTIFLHDQTERVKQASDLTKILIRTG